MGAILSPCKKDLPRLADKNFGVHSRSEGNEREKVIKYWISGGDTILTFGSVIKLLKTNQDFRNKLIEVLRENEYLAYFWETPAVSKRDVESREFEFVLVEDKQLDRMNPDYGPFMEHFQHKDETEDVTSFPNLGGDAILVVPLPADDDKGDFSHLAKFIRNAPDRQAHNLLRTVGHEVEKRLNTEDRGPLWLSTAGMGVPWLHVRLDSRPKYYSYSPYKVYAPTEALGKRENDPESLGHLNSGSHKKCKEREPSDPSQNHLKRAKSNNEESNQPKPPEKIQSQAKRLKPAISTNQEPNQPESPEEIQSQAKRPKPAKSTNKEPNQPKPPVEIQSQAKPTKMAQV